MSADQLKNAAEEKLAGLARLRRDGGVLRDYHAAKKLGELPGVQIKLSPSFFKEFVVNFDGAGKSVAEVNKALLGHQIFGGKDLSAEFPELGQSALYCVTEYYDQDDIDALARAVKEVTA